MATVLDPTVFVDDEDKYHVQSLGVKCPHCGKIAHVRTPVTTNVDAYHRSVSAQALCCGKLIVVHPVMRYAVEVGEASRKEDAWGYTVKS